MLNPNGFAVSSIFETISWAGHLDVNRVSRFMRSCERILSTLEVSFLNQGLGWEHVQVNARFKRFNLLFLKETGEIEPLRH